MVAAYQAGDSISEIQKRFDVGPGVLYGELRKAGIKPNRPLGRVAGPRSNKSVIPPLEVVDSGTGEVVGYAGPGGKVVPEPPEPRLRAGPERDARIVQMSDSGVAVKDIMAELGIKSYSTIYDTLKRVRAVQEVEVQNGLPEVDDVLAAQPVHVQDQSQEPIASVPAPESEPENMRYQIVTERVMRDVLTIEAKDFAEATRLALRIDGVTEVVSVSRLR